MLVSVLVEANFTFGATVPPVRRGPLYMVLASAFFIAMVAFAKVLRAEQGPLEIIWWRSLISVPVAWIVARSASGLQLTNTKGLVLRSFFGFVAMVCVFTAARGLAIADLSIIGKLQPLIVALLAPLVLGAAERVRGMTFFALALGLVGSAFIIGPGLDVGNTYGLWALGAAVFSAAAHLGVRALGRTESTSAIVFWFQFAILIYSGIGVVIAEGGFPPIPRSGLWPHLMGVGLAATAGQLFMTRAYALDRAATVAGAAYVAPLFALAADLALFGHLPGGYQLLGGALVISAGLLLLRKGAESAESAEGAQGVEGGV